jgi:hypothetical protein
MIRTSLSRILGSAITQIKSRLASASINSSAAIGVPARTIKPVTYSRPRLLALRKATVYTESSSRTPLLDELKGAGLLQYRGTKGGSRRQGRSAAYYQYDQLIRRSSIVARDPSKSYPTRSLTMSFPLIYVVQGRQLSRKRSLATDRPVIIRHHSSQ